MPGVSRYPYLDDILIRSPTFQKSEEDLQLTLHTLKQLGFVVNLDKSHLQPTQTLTHLGLILDTSQFQATLSTERQSRLIRALNQARDTKALPLLKLASLQGLMVSCQEVVPWSRFHLRPFQMLLRPYQDLIERRSPLKIDLPKTFVDSLAWWLAPGRVSMGTSLTLPTRKILTSDASLWGWGAHVEGKLVEGTWSPEEATQSINLLELRAIRQALLHFQDLLAGSHVLVRTDNITAKADINRQGAHDRDC